MGKNSLGSLYFTIDSMLCTRPIFDWHKESITKQEIANLIANEDFFTMYRLLAIAIICLPEINTFKISAMSALIAIEIWQNLGYIWSENNELVALMRRFEAKLLPFDLPYISGTDTPKICNIMDYNEDQTGANNKTSLENIFNNSIILLIRKVFDLETEENLESFVVNTVQADSFDNLDYDLCDVLDNFLEREKQ
ncbi:43140_t:CDS:2, partial [Gigaspora margarita]